MAVAARHAKNDVLNGRSHLTYSITSSPKRNMIAIATLLRMLHRP